MNYLAHAYLSFNDPGILTGNLISDFVKGRKQYDYPEEIYKGIRLHRLIDTFTDGHEATRLSKEILRPHYRLYSGALVDVIYDHFLATDTSIFSEQSLYEFSQDVFKMMDEKAPSFPQMFAYVYPYMKTHNWLFNYRHTEGIRRSLHGVMRRALYIEESPIAFELFMDHYQLFGEHFRHLWKDLYAYTANQYNMLK